MKKSKYKIGDFVRRVNYQKKSDEKEAKQFPESTYILGESFKIEEVYPDDRHRFVYFGNRTTGCYESELGEPTKLEKAMK